mmetsp:Transcript_62011/g.166653  ORF Transcript_62011/g.166653 Transcript_62011/m.166653 type:complete len:264 (+) Transcript_62011:3-794(+)
MIREQVSIRYQMLPTWYTIFAEWAGAGTPILRPLWYHNLDDKKAYEHTDDHFLVGESILVRAVTEVDAKAKRIEVYLPPGEWFDFWDDKAPPRSGGHSISVPLHAGHVPVFVRGGAILFKRMRRRRSAGAMAADPYTIVAYGQQASGHVYIDDGDSHEYHDGAFIYDRLAFDGASLRSEPGPALPAFGLARGMPNLPERHFRVERAVFVGLPRRPVSARLTGPGGEPELLQVTTEAASGNGHTATVKKPTGLLGARWSLDLVF